MDKIRKNLSKAKLFFIIIGCFSWEKDTERQPTSPRDNRRKAFIIKSSELTNPMDSDNFLLKRRSILKNRIFLRMDLFCEFLWIGFDRYTLPNESESGNHGIMLTSEYFYGGYYGLQRAHLYINCR